MVPWSQSNKILCAQPPWPKFPSDPLPSVSVVADCRPGPWPSCKMQMKLPCARPAPVMRTQIHLVSGGWFLAFVGCNMQRLPITHYVIQTSGSRESIKEINHFGRAMDIYMDVTAWSTCSISMELFRSSWRCQWCGLILLFLKVSNLFVTQYTIEWTAWTYHTRKQGLYFSIFELKWNGKTPRICSSNRKLGALVPIMGSCIVGWLIISIDVFNTDFFIFFYLWSYWDLNVKKCSYILQRRDTVSLWFYHGHHW